jgi:hypothetical protein
MAKAKVTFADLASGPSRLKRKEITIEEWGGGTFHLLEISGKTHRELIAKIEEIKGGDSSPNADKAGLLASTWLEHLLVDEDGNSPDKEWLMQQSLRLLIDICNQALEFNGLTEKIRESSEKNSESPGPEASGG